MSIGNLKTQGGKGTNFPFQWNVLRGLQGIINALTNSTAGVARKPGVRRAIGPFTNVTNFYSFSVANVGIANGLCLGATIKPGEIESFDASGLNNFFTPGVVTADGTGTELLITFIY